MADVTNACCQQATVRAARLIDLTHILSYARLVQCTKAMPQQLAAELPFVLGLAVSRAPFPCYWFPCLPAALVERAIRERKPALSLHGVSVPFAFVPVLVAECVLSPS